jgi:hypothetical protein
MSKKVELMPKLAREMDEAEARWSPRLDEKRS